MNIPNRVWTTAPRRREDCCRKKRRSQRRTLASWAAESSACPSPDMTLSAHTSITARFQPPCAILILLLMYTYPYPYVCIYPRRETKLVNERLKSTTTSSVQWTRKWRRDSETMESMKTSLTIWYDKNCCSLLHCHSTFSSYRCT